jgi:hypothetical protein
VRYVTVEEQFTLVGNEASVNVCSIAAWRNEKVDSLPTLEVMVVKRQTYKVVFFGVLVCWRNFDVNRNPSGRDVEPLVVSGILMPRYGKALLVLPIEEGYPNPFTETEMVKMERTNSEAIKHSAGR